MRAHLSTFSSTRGSIHKMDLPLLSGNEHLQMKMIQMSISIAKEMWVILRSLNVSDVCYLSIYVPTYLICTHTQTHTKTHRLTHPHKYVPVCVFVCVCVCVCNTHTHSLTHSHTHTHTHTHVCAYIHTNVYIYIQTYIFIHVHIISWNICIYILYITCNINYRHKNDIHTYIRTYIQTDRQTDIPTYVYTYIHTDRQTDIPTYVYTYIHSYVLHTYILVWMRALSISLRCCPRNRNVGQSFLTKLPIGYIVVLTRIYVLSMSGFW